MLFSKNNKKTGIVSILALALALVMMLVVCLTGCTDENAQNTADEAKTAADDAQSKANDAKSAADAAKTAADSAKSAADTAKSTADTAKAAAEAAITEEQLNEKLAEYLKANEGVKADELATAIANAINAALADYAKKSEVLTEAQVNTIVNNAIQGLGQQQAGVTMNDVTTAIQNALADYVKTTDLAAYAKTADVNTAIQNALADYVTQDALATALADYIKGSDLAEALEDYYTAEEIDGMIEDLVAGDIQDLYINIAEWDQVTAIYYAIMEGGTTAEAILANNQPENSTYEDDMEIIENSIYPGSFFDNSTEYTNDQDTVVTFMDFIDKYYDVVDTDNSGIAGDVQADYVLKLNALVKVRDRKLSNVTGYFDDLHTVATNGVDIRTAAAALNAALAQVGTSFGTNPTAEELDGKFYFVLPVEQESDDPTAAPQVEDEYFVIYLTVDDNGDIDGDIAAIYEIYEAAIEWATDYQAGLEIMFVADHNVIAEFDPADDSFVEFEDDAAYYGLELVALELANANAELFEDLYVTITTWQELVVTENPSIDDITIENDDDEIMISVLVGENTFDADSDVEGLYEMYDTANDGDLSAIADDNYVAVNEYATEILRQKFVKAQNQTLRLLTSYYTKFLEDNNISPNSDAALALATYPYVRFLDYVTELTFEDVKKEGLNFSFQQIIDDMNASLDQEWAEWQAEHAIQLP